MPVAPVPDAVSQPFWDAAAAGRLALQRCAGCGRVNHPPQVVCAWCASEALAFAEVPGSGRVVSRTSELRRPGRPGEGSPATILVVELDVQSGVLLVGAVEGERPAWAEIGTRVQAAFAPLAGTDVPLVQFVPEAG